MDIAEPWHSMLAGYAIGVLVEAPILLVGLSPEHPCCRKLFAGVWLTACTYPIVAVAMPQLSICAESWLMYVAMAETFAPAAECVLFWTAFDVGCSSRVQRRRDFLAIVGANATSFGVGLVLSVLGLFG